MENNHTDMKEEGYAATLINEVKLSSKRWFIAFLIMVLVNVLSITGFIWYLSQYDFVSTTEQTGVFTLIDSQGNIFSSDITPDQIKEIMEIISDGKNENN